jgi:hypothetical protein
VKRLAALDVAGRKFQGAQSKGPAGGLRRVVEHGRGLREEVADVVAQAIGVLGADDEEGPRRHRQRDQDLVADGLGRTEHRVGGLSQSRVAGALQAPPDQLAVQEQHAYFAPAGQASLLGEPAGVIRTWAYLRLLDQGMRQHPCRERVGWKSTGASARQPLIAVQQ